MAEQPQAGTPVNTTVQPAADCDRLGFLLARHGRIMNVRLRQALGVTGLGPRHAATLMRLARHGRIMNVRLRQALGVTGLGPRHAATLMRLARHGRIMNVRLRQALGVTGLGPRHAATLMRLAREGPTSQQNLIEALATDASALVTILNDLEDGSLVQRRRNPADRRRHIVEITSRGASAVRSVERAVAEVEHDAVTSLSEAEVGQLQTLLSRLHSGHSEAECDSD